MLCIFCIITYFCLIFVFFWSAKGISRNLSIGCADETPGLQNSGDLDYFLELKIICLFRRMVSATLQKNKVSFSRISEARLARSYKHFDAPQNLISFGFKNCFFIQCILCSNNMRTNGGNDIFNHNKCFKWSKINFWDKMLSWYILLQKLITVDEIQLAPALFQKSTSCEALPNHYISCNAISGKWLHTRFFDLKESYRQKDLMQRSAKDFTNFSQEACKNIFFSSTEVHTNYLL